MQWYLWKKFSWKGLRTAFIIIDKAKNDEYKKEFWPTSLMNSTLDDSMGSISIMPSLKGRKMPGDVHDFMNQIGISDSIFLKLIKDCVQYLEQHGVYPTDLSVRHVVDIEEPEHKYLRVLFVLPMSKVADVIKLQTQFYTDVYRDIIKHHLGEKMSELEFFRRRVNIVFDIEAN
jgi:hypothetical protein